MSLKDFFDQIPESIVAIPVDDKTRYLQGIIAHYGINSESFMYDVRSINGLPESHSEYYTVKLKSNTPGYVLTALLNIDFEAIAEIIADLEWKKNADIYSDPPLNFEEVYNRLLSVSDVFSFYLPSEQRAIQWDLESTKEGVAMALARLKKFIAFCDRQQVPYTGQFFNFLFSNGYFVEDPTRITPVEEIESLDSLYGEDGEFIDELDEIYDTFLHGFDLDTADTNYYDLGHRNRLQNIAMASFIELARRGKTIRQCQNCGKYFIPSKRADTLYCDNPSPEAPEMTCKEYGNRRLWYERQKEDEIATLSRKIASAKGMLAKRNPDLPSYAASYEYFKAQRLIWKKDVAEGRKTREEYREWLLLMQSQKTIKEAGQVVPKKK